MEVSVQKVTRQPAREQGTQGGKDVKTGPRVDKPDGSIVHWSDLVHDRTGKVPFHDPRTGQYVSEGAITAAHLAVESLHKLDPADPALVLAPLPREVIDCVLNYIEHYQPEAMRTNYPVAPAADQFTAAKHWIEKNVIDASAGCGNR